MAAGRARVSLDDGDGDAPSRVQLVGSEALLALARVRPLRVDAPLVAVAVAGGALVHVHAGRPVAGEGEAGPAPALVAALQVLAYLVASAIALKRESPVFL